MLLLNLSWINFSIVNCKVVHLPHQTAGRGDNSELLQFATPRKLIISLEKNSSQLISLAAMNTNFTNSVNISLKIFPILEQSLPREYLLSNIVQKF